MKMTAPGFSFLFDSPYHRYPNRHSPGTPNSVYGPIEELFPGLMQAMNIRNPIESVIGETVPRMKPHKNKFQVCAQVRAFAPQDLSVKTVDGCIIIRAKHGERRDAQGGWVTRDFIKKYQLPEGCDPGEVQCRLSPSGLLTVFVPAERNQQSNEREVPIMLIDSSRDVKDTVIKVETTEADPKPECASADEGPAVEAPVNDEE